MKSYQKLNLFLILLLSLNVFASFGQSITIERTKKIYADRDTYIYSNSVSSNYGGKNYLCIGELIMGYDHTFLHFDLSEIPEVFTKADLSLDFYYLPETIDISIYSTSSNWNELGLTWANAPSEGSLVGHFVDIAEVDVYHFGIYNFMESWSSSEISFIVKEYDYSETGYIQLSSREGANIDTDKPHLIFYYEEEIDDISVIVTISIIAGVVIIIGIVVFLAKENKTRNVQQSPLQPHQPIKLAQTTSQKFCFECGHKLPTDATFCTNCGKKLM